MATKKKAPAKKPAKPAPAEPRPCKCGKKAITLKIGGMWWVYCVNAYCDKSRRAWGTSEAEAVERWNKGVAGE